VLDKTTVRQIAQKYTEEVCKILNPKTVILFGSYVNGNPHEFSDIDIAVVFNSFQGDWYDTAVLLQRLRRGIDDDTPVGIEPHMMDETSDRSGFLEHVRKNGEIIYGV
jgi:predicted nucleotidyltransferase